MRNLIIAISAFGLFAGSMPVAAATHCRDPKGKFVKCTKHLPAKPARCRDAKGKFAKCGTKGIRSAK